jgi:hypothetical protein
MASTWARLYNYTSLLTSGAFYKSKPLETFLRAHCGDASMIDTTCDTSVKTVLTPHARLCDSRSPHLRSHSLCPTSPHIQFLASSLVSSFPAEVFLFRNYEYPVGVR